MEITLEADKALIGPKKTVPIQQFCRVVADNCVTGMSDKPIPDNVRWIVESGDRAVYIVELQPELHSIECYFGVCPCSECRENGTNGEQGRFTIATPYVILKVPFHKNRLQEYTEVFYRNRPIESLDDELFLTNLPNTANGGGESHGWMCMDGVKTKTSMTREQVLGVIVNHLWCGEFNNEISSSNFHNFMDCDKRLSSMAAWQEASLKDPSFVLGVNWESCRHTIGDAIRKHFSSPGPANVTRLGDLVLKAS